MKKPNKALRKTVRLTLVTASAVLLTLVYRHFSVKTETIRVAYYGLAPSLVTDLAEWLDGRGVERRDFILDDSKPLRSHIKKTVQYDLLFIYDGANMDSVSTIVRNAETAALQTLSLPVRISVQTEGRLTGTPLLLDTFHLLYSKEVLERMNASPPFTLARLENLAFNAKTETSPLLCAGKDDNHLIMLFSSLLEAQEGIERFDEALAKLKASKEDDFTAFFALEAVWNTLQRIGLWHKYGLLPRNWLELTAENLDAALTNARPLFVFAPLSFYRSLEDSQAQKYGLRVMPSAPHKTGRYLTAKTLAALQFSVPKSPLQTAAQATDKLAAGRALIRESLSAPSQTKLASSSRLVPSNSKAETDQAAQTVWRYVSAADGVMPDIAQASFTEAAQQRAFAEALRKELQRAAR
ncbi:hypothetical protein V1L52_00495 [Treponema sp. HNW]|uniref:hypothetical protein n=1 Tax=Treponema sp. HNW TaxID=3116654 RepID=UPI003D135999